MEIKKVSNAANQIMVDRCTVRNYDVTHKIDRKVMKNILQDAMTAPSSLNLQPWRFVVVDTPEGKEAMEPYMMFNGQQWATCSALVFVFGDMNNVAYAEQIYSANVEHNLMTEEQKNAYLDKIHAYCDGCLGEENLHTITQDCGFVGMQFMLAAKAYGYDTNPIGGFMKQEVTEALELDANRYKPILLYTIGKAVEEHHDSVRFSVDEVTQWK